MGLASRLDPPYKSSSSATGRGSFRGWLRRVVRNLVIDWLDHRRRRPAATDPALVVGLLTMNGGEVVDLRAKTIVRRPEPFVDVAVPRLFNGLVVPMQAGVSATTWRGKIGERFDVDVTGQTSGPVWGSDVYTDDSLIAAAAVHAGLLKPGETATLTVTIVKSPEKHVGSTQNGVTSADWGGYPASYLLRRKAETGLRQ